MRRALDRLRGRGPLELAIPVPWALLDVLREGPAPLAPGGVPQDGPLRIGIVVPAFRRGSGGHRTIADLVRGLEARGHSCSLWVADDEGRHASEGPEATGASFAEFFGPVGAPIRAGLDGWDGADVALATGWQTVAPVLRLAGARGRAYLAQDHEPDFYGVSAEREWAAQSYRAGLHCIAASPWLAGVLRERYGASASAFDLGVDHAVYTPGDGGRRDDQVLVYARGVTPRRAVPLALLAMAELKRRRPDVEVALFGETRHVRAPFAFTDLGVLDAEQLAAAYRTATVGVVLSLTNPSLVPTEMLACGLPVVDVASDSMRATFGFDGPISLANPDPLVIAATVEGLLDDPAEREECRRAGLELAGARTWARAAEQVEAGLRLAAGAP